MKVRLIGIISLTVVLLGLGYVAFQTSRRPAIVKKVPKPVKRDPKGWYEVPRGTTVEDLGLMVPAEFEATPYPWGLQLTSKLTPEQLKTFTGQITVYDPRDQYSYLELEFMNGSLGPDQPPDSQEGLSKGTSHRIWKLKGKTIADIGRNLPEGAEMRFFIHFGPEDKVKLPRDAHLLAHFTGFVTSRGKCPESSFELLDGKVESQSVTNPGPGGGGATFIIEERKELTWLERITENVKALAPKSP